MARDIIAEQYPWETRVAVLEEGRLVEVFWSDKQESVGNIYKGRVKDLIPGLSCAFVDVGMAKNAYLQSGDISMLAAVRGGAIDAALHSGQEVMVQVKKEPFADKGARVTGDITIPGHFLVLLPYQNDVSISRKIVADDRREHLRRLMEKNKPERVGIILRTACQEAEDNEILGELRRLLEVWTGVKSRYDKTRAPALIYEDLGVLERALRDYMDGDISRVITNNLKIKEQVEARLQKDSPSKAINIKYSEGDLFEKYGVEKELRKAVRRKVWLKSGGYLIFDSTEAMTVIDVNSGKFTGKNDFETTVRRLNLEAAVEIPRQLRLRSIGGIIIVDFINMKCDSSQEEVIATLRQELHKDKAHSRIIGMTGLGLLEMTRKKSRYGLDQIFDEECSCCQGKGHTINIVALAGQVKRKLANLGYLESGLIICELHPHLHDFIMKDEKNLAYIEQATGKQVKLVAVDGLSLGQYNIYPG